MKSILDPSFRYVVSYATDLRKTFARIRREQVLKEPPVRRQTPVAPLRVVRKRSA